MENLDNIFGTSRPMPPSTVFTPGIVHGMPEALYHSVPAIGSSPLKRFHECPATAFEPVEQTEAMALGSAQDCYTLYGVEEFNRRFIVCPDFGDMRTAKAKADKSAFVIDYAGFTVLPPTVTTQKIPTLQAIVDVDNFLYNEHPMTRIIMRQGDQQVSLFWIDDMTGLHCKGRIDHVPDAAYKTIFDLKMCSRIDNFHKQMTYLGYGVQGGHYTVGALKLGIDVVGFAFIAFCFGNPPKVRIVAMDDEYMEKAMRLSCNTLSMITECREANNFPKHSIPIDTVSLASMLGIASDTAKQLSPQDLIEVVQPPYSWREV